MNLKSILILVTLLSAMNSTLFGQQKNKWFQLGVQLGIDGSLFDDRIGEYGDNAFEDYKNYVRISGMLGIKGKIILTKIVAIHPEINFSLRGGSYRLENNSVVYIGGSGDEKAYYYKNYRLNYIETPILMSFNISRLFNKEIADNKLQIHLNSGLAPAFNTGSSLRYNGFRAISNGTPLADVKETYEVEKFGYAENFVMSYIAEFSIEFQNGHSQNMFVNLRLSQTKNDVYNIEELDGYNMQTKMTTIYLVYGLMF